MPKLTLHEWYFAQHVSPEVQPLFDRLFELPKVFRESTVGIGNHESLRPLTDTEKDICRICADELEAIIGKTS